jgi:UrcA family protein
MTRALVAAAVFIASTIPAAHAAPKEVVVAYGDLNLSAAAGQSELKARLQDAAAKLCSPVFVGPDYRGSEQSARELMEVYHACIGRLSDRAMAKITRN